MSSYSSSSSDSSSEDSSLDSSNEDGDDLFKRASEEMHHFPSSSKPPPLPLSASYYTKSEPLDKKHQLVPNAITTSSATQIMVTPPSGTTHLPRPHPQSVLNERSFVPSHNQTSRHSPGARPRKKPASMRGSNTASSSHMRGRRSKNALDMSTLFGKLLTK